MHIVKVGQMVHNIEENTRYRVIHVTNDSVFLCDMNGSKFCNIEVSYKDFIDLLHSGKVTLLPAESHPFNVDKLSDSARADYERKRDIMHDVANEYGPDYMRLNGKGPKPQLKAIMKKYGLSSYAMWKYIRKYLQSGFSPSVFLDGRKKSPNKGRTYNYTKKPGRPAVHADRNYICTEEDFKHFDEALSWYKKGRYRSKRLAFLIMSDLYYATVEVVNGVSTKTLLPQAERPTLDQFYNYVRKHLTKEEEDRIKTSAMEVRNDKRIRNSDAYDGVYYVCDMVEIDACEVDVSLVSELDKNQTVGRPTVYVAIDVLTHVIIAVAVSFDQNSLVGITRLFLNLIDDKQELCARYGINLSAESAAALWPSNVLPRRIRVDRGAEFTSAEFDRICNELGIEKNVVSGGSGSLKGTVEQVFHQLHCMQNAHLEGSGLITDRHDSKHHKEATLNIEQFKSLLLNEVIAYNQKYNPNYPLSPEMIKEGIEPRPAVLWKYYVENRGAPRPIIDKEHYLFSLMSPVDASVSNEGIIFEELYYLADDPYLDELRYKLGDTHIPFPDDIRMDKRTMKALYYLRGDELVRAPLNPDRKDNAEYGDLSYEQWLEYKGKKKAMDAKGEESNQQLEVNAAKVTAGIVDSAKKTTASVDKNMRESRHAEKQRVSAKDDVASRLPDKMPGDLPEREDRAGLPDNTPADDAPADDKEVTAYKNFDEALEDFRENR